MSIAAPDERHIVRFAMMARCWQAGTCGAGDFNFIGAKQQNVIRRKEPFSLLTLPWGCIPSYWLRHKTHEGDDTDNQHAGGTV